MKILIITHCVKADISKEKTSGYIIQNYLRELGNEVIQIYKEDWSSILKINKQFSPDIIMTIGPIGALICFLKKVKVIKAPVVFNWNDYYVEIMGEKYGKKLIGFLENYAVKNSEGVLSSSKRRYEMAREFGKNAAYIKHGIDKKLIDIKFKKIKMKGIYDTNIVYAGAQTKFKRVDELVKSMKNIKANLYLLGDINKDIQKEAPANVYFLGHKDQKSCFWYIMNSDFAIVTSDDDSATKMIEYLAFAKRILAPNGRMSSAFGGLGVHFYNNFKHINDLIKNKKMTCKRQVRIWDDVAKEYIKYFKEIILNTKNKK
jgi:hypothetical protein